MKNYELIEELMKLPAGYDVKFGCAVQKDEMEGKDMIFAGGSVEDIQVSDLVLHLRKEIEMERRTQPGYEYHSCDFMDDGVYMDMNLLREYEDTALIPEQIHDLKERDTAKAQKIYKNKFSDAYTCPNCNLALISKTETDWICGKHYKFCPDCGQRIKWED